MTKSPETVKKGRDIAGPTALQTSHVKKRQHDVYHTEKSLDTPYIMQRVTYIFSSFIFQAFIILL